MGEPRGRPGGFSTRPSEGSKVSQEEQLQEEAPGSSQETGALQARRKALFFGVKTTKGQELNVALMIENRARTRGLELYSIVAPTRPGGFLILEAPRPSTVELLTRDIRHVRGRIKGVMGLEDVKSLVKPRLTAELLEPGMEVEVIAGPLRGSRGQVLQVNKSKNEVVLQVYEAAYPLKVTVPGEHVKPVAKGGG